MQAFTNQKEIFIIAHKRNIGQLWLTCKNDRITLACIFLKISHPANTSDQTQHTLNWQV